MAESIATLGIRVRAEGVKDAERDLKGLAQAGEVAEKRASTLGKAWGLALGGAIAGGAALAVTGLKKWIANGIESEKVQAQLAARIKSTGAAAGLAVPQLNKMAAALQAATTFDDESIGRAQATLLTFTRVGRQNFERATEAVLDMSTALGTDLNSAALQVGKALNDPVQGLTALSRAGVQFSDSQKTTIKQLVETGRVADAQKIILRELETQMGGSARAARDTLGGALAALQNSFDNLLEGDVGGLRGARDAVEGFNRALNDPQLKAGLDSAFTGMVNLANGAVQLIAKLGNAASALREFYGENDRKSIASLVNRRNQLETDLFRAERRSGFGLGDANDPIGKLLGRPNGREAEIAALRKELAEIDALITQRQRAAAEASRRFSPEYERASLNFNPNPKALATLDTGTGTGKVKALRSVGDAAKEAAGALQDYTFAESALEHASFARIDVQTRSLEQFARIRAELSGPLAVAELDHIQRLQDIERLGKEAGVTGQAIADAQEAQRAAYERTTAAILEQQRVMANPEVVRTLDTIRRAGTDALTDLVTGARSAKDAFRDFFDSIAEQITRAIAEQWMTKLFGQMGTSGAGTSGGNLLGSLLGGLFGGGRAIGGPVSAGRVYQVNERGAPEIYTAGGKQFLLAPRDGRVTPATAAGGGRASQINQTFVVNGTPDRMTRQQMLRMAGSETSRAIRRG